MGKKYHALLCGGYVMLISDVNQYVRVVYMNGVHGNLALQNRGVLVDASSSVSTSSTLTIILQ